MQSDLRNYKPKLIEINKHTKHYNKYLKEVEYNPVTKNKDSYKELKEER